MSDKTIFSFKLLAKDYERFDPRIKPGVIGSFTRILHNDVWVDAQIIDVEVDDETHLLVTLEI